MARLALTFNVNQLLSNRANDESIIVNWVQGSRASQISPSTVLPRIEAHVLIGEFDYFPEKFIVGSMSTCAYKVRYCKI